MPRRTNAFQSVVYLIKKHVGNDKAKVYESAELLDSATGKKREVDVCIETEVDGHFLLVGFECAARGRRPDVEWVEQMYGKHATLPTDRLVLVSESGFTAQARAKAKAFEIETIIPDQETDRSIDELAHRLTRLRFTKLDLLNIENVYVTLGATDTEGEENIHLLPSSGEMHVFTVSREFIGTIKDVVNAFMTIAAQDKSLFEDILFDAADDTQFFELSIDPPEVPIGDPPTAQRIYFEKIEPTLHLRMIEQIRIDGKARIERSNFPLRHGTLQEVPYSWGESFGRSTVGRLVPDLGGVSAQHRVLVPEHQQLSVLRQVRAGYQDSQAEYPAGQQVDALEQHPASQPSPSQACWRQHSAARRFPDSTAPGHCPARP